MKIGDIILNTAASEDNPIRYSFFVKYDGPWITCITKESKQVLYRVSEQKKSEFLKVVGHIPIKPSLESFTSENPPESLCKWVLVRPEKAYFSWHYESDCEHETELCENPVGEYCRYCGKKIKIDSESWRVENE